MFFFSFLFRQMDFSLFFQEMAKGVFSSEWFYNKVNSKCWKCYTQMNIEYNSFRSAFLTLQVSSDLYFLKLCTWV